MADKYENVALADLRDGDAILIVTGGVVVRQRMNTEALNVQLTGSSGGAYTFDAGAAKAMKLQREADQQRIAALETALAEAGVDEPVKRKPGRPKAA